MCAFGQSQVEVYMLQGPESVLDHTKVDFYKYRISSNKRLPRLHAGGMLGCIAYKRRVLAEGCGTLSTSNIECGMQQCDRQQQRVCSAR